MKPTINYDSVAQDVAGFAAAMTPAKARWEYALSRAGHVEASGHMSLDNKTFPSLARFLGVRPTTFLGSRLRNLTLLGGFEAAREHYLARPFWREHDPYAVGPIEPWQIGHVYFLRVASHPHVAKVGFSRRVRERVDEIRSVSRVGLELAALNVGTLADEHWWHHNWRSLRISGEWFYWPKSTERSLPPFLVEKAHADDVGEAA